MAGSDGAGFSGDGGPAVAAQLDQPMGLAADDAGVLFISDSLNSRVRKVDSSGRITTVFGPDAPNVPPPYDPQGLSLAPDGLLVADPSGQYLVRPDGTATRATVPVEIVNQSFPTTDIEYEPGGRVAVIGDGSEVRETPYPMPAEGDSSYSVAIGSQLDNNVGLGCEGGPADEASLWGTSGLALAPGGGLLVSDRLNGTIHRVVNGIATLFARVANVVDIASDPTGHVYADGGGFIVRIDPDGRIGTIAGGGSDRGEGVPALQASISPGRLATDTAGNLFFVDGNKVRRIGDAADAPTAPPSGSGGSATATAAAAGAGSPGRVHAAVNVDTWVFDTLEVTGDGRIDFSRQGQYGSPTPLRLNQPISGIEVNHTGSGAWQVAPDGGVFAYGTAPFLGSMGGVKLNQPVVGIAQTPTCNGYWLVAADGGIFSFGDARFYGSTGAIRLNQPIVGMAATPTGHGYWLVARDGGIFTFGDAAFFGSTGDIRLAQPIVGMAPTMQADGYWLVAADGGIFTFGGAPFCGSAADQQHDGRVVGMVAGTGSDDYVVATSSGQRIPFRCDTEAVSANGSGTFGVPYVALAAFRQYVTSDTFNYGP